MNATRIVIFTLLGLLIGVLIGFGFRGSLADLLNLNAATLPIFTHSGNPTGTSSQFNTLNAVTDLPFASTDAAFIRIANEDITGVSVPVVVKTALHSYQFDLGVLDKATIADCFQATPASDSTKATLGGCLMGPIHDYLLKQFPSSTAK